MMFSEKSPSGYLVSLASGKSAVAHFLIAGLVPTRQHCPGWVCILVTATSGSSLVGLPREPCFPGELLGWVTEGVPSVGVVGKGLSPREINSPRRVYDRLHKSSGRHTPRRDAGTMQHCQ